MILDVGCGHISAHQARGHINIDILKPKTIPKNFVKCDAHNLPFRNQCFSKVFFYDVIEHVENPTRCLKEINRVLKTAGRIEVSTPNILHYRSFFKLMRKGHIVLCDTAHIAGWSEAELKNILLNSGFSNIFFNYVILEATKQWDSKLHIFFDVLFFKLFRLPIFGRNILAYGKKRDSF